MKEKRQLVARIKRLREEVHKLELRVVVLKAMLQSGEAELERRKDPPNPNIIEESLQAYRNGDYKLLTKDGLVSPHKDK